MKSISHTHNTTHTGSAGAQGGVQIAQGEAEGGQGSKMRAKAGSTKSEKAQGGVHILKRLKGECTS
jgi:hypothetical protein